MKPTLDPLSRAEVNSVAKQLGVKPEEVVEMEMRLAGQDVALEPGDSEDEQFAPIAYLPDPADEPSRVLESQQEQTLKTDGLAAALSQLDPRSRRIIEARWLREKETATLHDLAAEFKVSAERIRQIEAKALAKMKGMISAS
jgi:RNA polymerase sigma-32 factor